MMKRTLALTLISLPALFFSANVFALGCVAATIDIQIAVRDKNSPPPKQTSRADHIQGDNCYGQTAVNVNKQVSVAPTVKEQTSHTTIVQDTPAEHNPLNQYGLPSNWGNVSLKLPIQVDVAVPYYKEAKQIANAVKAAKASNK